MAGPTLSDLLAPQFVGDYNRRTLTGQIIHKMGPRLSGEFRRIEGLARRQWENAIDLPELTRLLTEWLRPPSGGQSCGRCGPKPDNCPTSLWPTQAAALREAHDVRGLFGGIAVGEGKAMISLLAPTVMEAQRPLLLMPASVRQQTLEEVIPKLRRHGWRLHPRLEIRSYTELSMAKNKDLLDTLQPDLIIADEAHELRGRSSARTKRVARYMRDRPYTMVVILSGSPTDRSLRDYWHLLAWALKPDLMPLPSQWPELCEWADALDVDVPEDQRLPPGALSRLCHAGESAVGAYRRRLTESRGVLCTSEAALGIPLRIRAAKPEVPQHVGKMVAAAREFWEDPNGDPVVDAKDLWRVMRQLALGFWLRWDPPAPAHWLFARKEWKRYVRERLRHNRKGIDSEQQVENEAKAMRPQPEAYRAWAAVRKDYEITTVPVWLDDFAVTAAGRWARETGGIVWTEHVEFGERAAALAGLPYFGGGDERVRTYKGPCVASVQAHGTGKNLQQWHRMLFVAPMPSASRWEQALGRCHRRGQGAPEVVADVWQHVPELVSSFQDAMARARWTEESHGQRQRLCYARLEGLEVMPNAVAD